MSVAVRFPSGKEKKYPEEVQAGEICKDAEFCSVGSKIIAVRINNELSCLSTTITADSTIEPITIDSFEGTRIYRRSLCLLLALAAKQIFKQRRLIISHSLGNSYFYYFDGLDKVTQEDLSCLEERMRRIVKQNLQVKSGFISYARAVEYFECHNQNDTVLLLKYKNESTVRIYQCGDFIDLFHGPHVPNTGLLKSFQLLNHPPGFLLRFPPHGNNPITGRLVPESSLLSIYREYKNWGKILNVSCAGHLNELIGNRKIEQFIQIAEALHDKKISQIADKIAGQRDFVKIVLVAGPSSSGKTTFAKKLAIQLRVLGRNPLIASLDDYFKPRQFTPRDENGNYNFEDIEALDTELLNSHLLSLMRGESINLPLFDFKTGSRKQMNTPLKLSDRGILILEGIHGLNPQLTPRVERENKFTIYVSALTQLNIDDHNRISTTDNRLLRRIVRDNQFRGHSAFTTIGMWESVRKGEDKNIFPYQGISNAVFNSALDYELSVLKVYADTLLRTIKPSMPEYQEARRLLAFLNNFASLPETSVPPQSILREFIGGSAFRY